MSTLATSLVGLLVLGMQGRVTEHDQRFVIKASEGNRGEVMLGRLAAQRGQSGDIRRFGQHMVTDHTMAQDRLRLVASRLRIALPTGASAEAQRDYDRLSKMTGKAFDLAYKHAMVEDHEKDVAEFSEMSRTARDPRVRRYASQTLPSLRQHLRMIRAARP